MASISLSLIVGFLIGHFTVRKISESETLTIQYYQTLIEDVKPNGLDTLLNTINVDNIKKNLR